MRLVVEIPGQPIPQARPRVTRNGTYYPKRVKAYRDEVTRLVRQAHNGEPIAAPCSVRIDVFGARANSDLDNFAKLVLDCLQDAGVLSGDDVRRVDELTVCHGKLPPGAKGLRIDVRERHGAQCSTTGKH